MNKLFKPEKPQEPEKKKDEKRLSFFARVLLMLVAINQTIAKSCPLDLPMLKGLGLQFIGIYSLIFSVQACAFSFLLNNLIAGIGMAFLSASLIILADRYFLTKDFRDEGELEYKKRNNSSPLELTKIRMRRFVSQSVRYIFAIIVSLAIVHFAEPGILRYEVEQIFRQQEQLRNAAYYSDVKTFEKELRKEQNQLKNSIKEKQLQVQQNRERIDFLSEAIDQQSDKVGNASSINDKAEILAKISKFGGKAAELEREAAKNDRCANAEQKGIKDRACADIDPSGEGGCGRRCKQWLSYKNIALKRAEEFRDNITILKAQLTALETRQRQDQEQLKRSSEKRDQLIISMQNEISDIQANIKSILVNIKNDQKRINDINVNFSKYVNEQADQIQKRRNVTFEMGGIVNGYDTVGKIKKKAEENTLWTLIFLKIFLVFLETIIFSSRLLGTTPGYSIRVYLAHEDSIKEAIASVDNLEEKVLVA